MMRDDEMRDLFPCAHCGSDIDNATPRPFPTKFNWKYGRRAQVLEWAARCGNPDCASEIVGPTAEAVTERWNRRELCRAAPAGADTGNPVSEQNQQDSAPAGSGEVHRAMNEIETAAWLALRKTPEQLGEEARKELAARDPDWLDTGRLCMGTGKPEWPHNCTCPKHAQPHPTDFPHVQRFDWTEDGMEPVRPECYGPNEYVQWDEYAALLRKLQQGAE